VSFGLFPVSTGDKREVDKVGPSAPDLTGKGGKGKELEKGKVARGHTNLRSLFAVLIFLFRQRLLSGLVCRIPGF